MLDHRTWNLSFRLVLISALLVISGFWLRFDAPIAPYLRDAFGGITYVLVFVLLFGAVIPNGPSISIAAGVLFATCCLEFLQLWHPAWLEACRRTLVGRLLLGHDVRMDGLSALFHRCCTWLGAVANSSKEMIIRRWFARQKRESFQDLRFLCRIQTQVLAIARSGFKGCPSVIRNPDPTFRGKRKVFAISAHRVERGG